MSDDLTPPGAPPTAQPVEPPAPAAPSPLDQLLERQAATDRQIAALADVVRTSMQARQPVAQPGQPAQPLAMTPELRQYLRAEGLTDADIDHNAAIVQPFIRAALRQVAPEIVG